MENSLNQPRKDYFEPMHTTEHILNQTMVRMFGCPRSRNAHIEKKKSKCDYILDKEPTAEQIQEIEQRVNQVIFSDVAVTSEIVTRENVPSEIDLSRLPLQAGETLRIVRVGQYDVCPCIGAHVTDTSEIGCFKIISYEFNEGVLRLRFRLEER